MNFFNINLKDYLILFLKIFIFLICVFLLHKNLKGSEKEIVNYIKNTDLLFLFIILIFSFFSNFFQMLVTKNYFQLTIKKKIDFFFFSKVFFNSQLINIIIPHFGFFLKGYMLKKINISYRIFILSHIFFFWFGFFYNFILYALEILIFCDFFQEIKILISFLFFSISLIVFFIGKYSFVIANKIFNLKTLAFISIELLKLSKILKVLNFQKIFKLMIAYSTTIHILNFFAAYFVIKTVSPYSFELGVIFLFFIINSILDQFPIIPKNLVLGELTIGYIFLFFGLDFELGVTIKILLRLAYFLNLFILVFLSNLYKLKIKKKNNN